MGRILGIDVGERRIGIAISTPEGTLAVPLRIVDAQGDQPDALTIIEIARAEGVQSLVVGHPRSLSGEAGPQARRVEAFARMLGETSGLPVELWDERLTTEQAGRAPPGRKKKRKPAPADDIAAALILQAYLDHKAIGRRHAP